MASTPKKLGRPTTRTPREGADLAGVARMFVEIDAGPGPGVHVTIDFKIAFRPGSARGTSRVAGARETPSAELSDEQLPDQQPDAPGDGPYIFGLFGMPIPVSRLKTRRRRFGRRG
jgi:hypothetical protein